VRVEEEGQPRREIVDVEPGADTGLDVGEAVGEGERELLHGGRSRLADMVAADADRVPPGNSIRAEGHDIGDDPHRGFRREDP